MGRIMGESLSSRMIVASYRHSYRFRLTGRVTRLSESFARGMDTINLKFQKAIKENDVEKLRELIRAHGRDPLSRFMYDLSLGAYVLLECGRNARSDSIC
jgi:hypothetical protein